MMYVHHKTNKWHEWTKMFVYIVNFVKILEEEEKEKNLYTLLSLQLVLYFRTIMLYAFGDHVDEYYYHDY